MARYFITNVKQVEGEGVVSEYDYAGNTKVLGYGERVEVSFDEGQTALGRLRDGVAYEEFADGVEPPHVAAVADAAPVVEAAPVVIEEPVVEPPVADVVADVPKVEEKPEK